MLRYVAWVALWGWTASPAARQVQLIGWPAPDWRGHGNAPAPELGSDPVLGRMTCPPLSRLDLARERSDGVVFRSVTTDPSGKIWTYHLRSGIYFWSGSLVQTTDFEVFFKDHLAHVVRKASLGVWQTPEFELTHRDSSVTVKWHASPPFGPYIFNGHPFFRNTGNGWECVGIFRPDPDDPARLIPTPGYPSPPVHQIEVSPPATGPQPPPPAGVRRLQFRMAAEHDLGWTATARIPELAKVCPYPVLLPHQTVIRWNLKSAKLQQQEVRQLLGSVIPRQHLAAVGSMGLAAVHRSLLPGIHPGLRGAEPQEMPLRQAATELTRLGWHLRESHRPRQNAEGQRLHLRLGVPRHTPQLLLKVLGDVYAVLGIGLEPVSTATSDRDLDGMLQELVFPWPESNLAPLFAVGEPLGAQAEAARGNLQRSLLAYAEQITTERPQLSTLTEVETALAELAWQIPLIQHRACLCDSETAARRPVREKDPDWFREWLLQ